jgi:hypothetical protein
MHVIIRPRQGGKTTEILKQAAAHHAYIVVPTLQDVTRLWREILRLQLELPQPITWQEFINKPSTGTCVVIDDLDRCVQFMTRAHIAAVSLSSGGEDVWPD